MELIRALLLSLEQAPLGAGEMTISAPDGTDEDMIRAPEAPAGLNGHGG